MQVAAMDREHQRLVGLMNALHQRHVAGDADRAELGKLLDEFGAFVVEHFAHEEAYMASIGYEGLESHKKVHANLLEKWTAKRREFDAGDGKLSDALFHFLKFWLNAHIQGVDVKYGAVAVKR